jgi:hypothetical protein
MPRKRERDAPPVVHRTARCGLRATRAQRNRLFGLLRPASDVWCAVLELNQWRRRRHDPPLAGYRELCRELASSGPGTFGELDSAGARSVLRRYSDAWFATAARRPPGIPRRRYPGADANGQEGWFRAGRRRPACRARLECQTHGVASNS